MDEKPESFACRMVRRRVSLKNDHDRDGTLNPLTNRDLQRRNNILKAIDHPHYQRELDKGMGDRNKFDESYNDSAHFGETVNLCNNNNNEQSIDSYDKTDKISEQSPSCATNKSVSSPSVKSFGFAKLKWRGPLANNYFTKRSSVDFKRIEDLSTGHTLSTNESNIEELIGKSSNFSEGNIHARSKMVQTLKNTDNSSEKILVSNMSETSRSSLYSLGSISAVIDDLDAQIKALEIEEAANNEHNNRIYPVIENIKFDSTGWTPPSKCTKREKSFEAINTGRFNKNLDNAYSPELTSQATENDRSKKTQATDDSNEYSTYHETPKKFAKKIPNMESTRKSHDSNSTKNKFPMFTRTESTISTIAVSPTSEINPEYKCYNNTNDTIADNTLNMTTPYDVDRFLHDALGDELCNTTITYDDKDITTSQFNVSELMSEATPPFQRNSKYDKHHPATDPLPGNSNTLNRTMGLCRTLSQRFKKKFRSSAIKTKAELPSPPLIPKTGPSADIVGHLLQEVSVQQTLMNQASKALNVCHTMKEFMESSERVESDRLLLISSLRRTAALEEIKRVSSEESHTNKKVYLGEKGEITIKDLILNLRECPKNEPQEGEIIEWFVVVISQGLKVWATRAMSCPIYSSRIEFPEIISIPNLMPNFKILVQVYSLKLRNSVYNHEDKYRIRRMKRSTSCPPFNRTPSRYSKKNDKPLSPKLYPSNASKSGCTCFVLSGFIELFLQDLSLSPPWPLMLVPENSILDRTIDLNIACRLHLSVSHEGFLTHGDEAGGFASWNRRWCVLKGHTIMMWNYPRDQESKDPLTVIELVNCVSNKITTANRKICAKPKTLLIETVRRRNVTDIDSMVFECRTSCTIVRNFLSCDNTYELAEWATKLNHIIQALQEWNVIGKRPLEVSDL